MPQQALQLDQAGTFVLVVDRDEQGPGPPHRDRCGLRGTRIVVRKGLAAGERMITEGIQKVRPGQVVQAAEVKPEA